MSQQIVEVVGLFWASVSVASVRYKFQLHCFFVFSEITFSSGDDGSFRMLCQVLCYTSKERVVVGVLLPGCFFVLRLFV